MDLALSDSSLTSTLTDFPVKVVLTASNFNYADASPDGTAADASASDLAFVMSGDSTNTQLPYQVDTWNPGGTSVIWVQVPSLTSSEEDLELYYGGSAPAGTYNGPATGSAVWSNGYTAVNEFSASAGGGETQPSLPSPLPSAPQGPSAAGTGLPTGTTFPDTINGAIDEATLANNGATSGNYLSTAVLGNDAAGGDGEAVDLSGVTGGSSSYGGTYMTMPEGVADNSGNLTLSTTVYIPSSVTSATTSDHWAVEGQDITDGLFLWTDGTTLNISVGGASSIATTIAAGWNTIDITLSGGTGLDLYVNGVSKGTVTSTAAVLQSPTSPFAFGQYDVSGTPISTKQSGAFAYDQFTAADVTRSANWVQAEYESQTNKLITYGSLESQGTPTGVAISGNQSSATITWNPVSNATQYDIYEGTTSGGESATPVATAGAGADSYDVTGLAPGTYYFTVAAVTSSGTSVPSSEVSYTYDATPTGVTITGNDGSPTISWNAVDDATQYDIYEGTTSGGESSTPFATVSGSATSYQVTGLTDDTNYYFTVAAVVPTGTSSPSTELSYEWLPAPTDVTATAYYDGSTVAVSWAGVTGASSYSVYDGTSSGGESSTPVECAQLTSTSCLVTGLNPGSVYYFTVEASGQRLASAPSSEASASTPATDTTGDHWQVSGAPYRLPLQASDGSLVDSQYGFPAKVVLTPQNFDYAGDSPDGTAADATSNDLAFVQANDSAPSPTQLPYEVDTWNPGGTSVLWVWVPILFANSPTNLELYYGPGATYNGPDASAVWSNGYTVVNQFSDSNAGGETQPTLASPLPTAPQSPSAAGTGIPDGTTFPDSIGGSTNEATLQDNSGVTSGDYLSTAVQGATGGQAVDLSGETSTSTYGGTYLTLPDTAGDNSGSITLSTTVYIPASVVNSTTYQAIAGQHYSSATLTGAIFLSENNGCLYAAIYGTGSGYTFIGGTTCAATVTAGWHTIDVTVSGTTAYLYVDGVVHASSTLSSAINPAPTEPFTLGQYSTGVSAASPSAPYAFDQLTISDVARSSEWVQAEYASDKNQLITYGSSQSATTPVDVTASGHDGSATVSWQPGLVSSGVIGYDVYEGTTSGGESSTPVATDVTTGSYTINGLTPGTYYFTVAADNGGGNVSLPSSEASYTYIAAPTGVSATDFSDSSVELNWSASTDASSYSVYEGTTSGGESATPIACTPLTATSCVVSGLTYDQSYYFTVTATNGQATSDPSTEVTGIPGLETPWAVQAAGERLPIILNNLSLSSSETDQPVEVQLPATFDYANASPTTLEFLIPGDTTPLPYEVTDWDDATTGLSTIWVEVPTLAPDGPSLYMYYNGLTAQASAGATLSQTGPEGTAGSTEYYFTTTGATIDGTPQIGDTLTADTSGFTPAADVYSYQWYDDGNPITYPDGTDANGPTLALTPALLDSGAINIGDAITLEIDGFHGDITLSPVSAPVTLAAGSFTPGTVEISGQPAVGGTLTADPGNWSPSGTPSYQWLLNGQLISGATAQTYTLTPDEFGSQISVQVTESADGYTNDEVTSAPVTVGYGTVVAGTPTITGDVQVGQSVSVDTGSWSPSAMATYQWMLDGNPISGAIGPTYTITSDDAGHVLSVAVTEQPDGFGLASATSAGYEVEPGVFTPGVPSISGQDTVGSTLSASSGDWAPQPANLGYQWLLNGQPIQGATEPTYTVAASDAGDQISVEVYAAAPGFQSASATSSGVTIAAARGQVATQTATLPKSTAATVTLTAGVKSTTITEVSRTLKAGTVLTVEIKTPGAKRLKKATVKVSKTKRSGYTDYSYKTGSLPAGKTTIRFYEQVGKKLKLVRIETIHVKETAAKKSVRRATRRNQRKTPPVGTHNVPLSQWRVAG